MHFSLLLFPSTVRKAYRQLEDEVLVSLLVKNFLPQFVQKSFLEGLSNVFLLEISVNVLVQFLDVVFLSLSQCIFELLQVSVKLLRESLSTFFEIEQFFRLYSRQRFLVHFNEFVLYLVVRLALGNSRPSFNLLPQLRHRSVKMVPEVSQEYVHLLGVISLHFKRPDYEHLVVEHFLQLRRYFRDLRRSSLEGLIDLFELTLKSKEGLIALLFSLQEWTLKLAVSHWCKVVRFKRRESRLDLSLSCREGQTGKVFDERFKCEKQIHGVLSLAQHHHLLDQTITLNQELFASRVLLHTLPEVLDHITAGALESCNQLLVARCEVSAGFFFDPAALRVAECEVLVVARSLLLWPG